MKNKIRIKNSSFYTGILLIAVSISMFWNTTSSFAKDMVYGGRVIDADTKEPIEGAVVAASWIKERATVAGPSTSFYDVAETMTDKEGKWKIEGPKGNCGELIRGLLQLVGLPCIQEPNFIVFKPGYCSWSFAAFGIDACKGKLKPRGQDGFLNGETIELPMLINKEDRRLTKPAPVGNEKDWSKQNLLINLIREEWRYLYSEDPGDLYRIKENKNEKK